MQLFLTTRNPMKNQDSRLNRGALLQGCIVASALCVCLICGGLLAPGAVSAADSGKPLAVGEKAPDFELPLQGQDSYLTLSKLIADGPVVVVVLRGYPGYQCPICSRQVGGLVNRAKTLSRALGEQPNRVVLVYPGEDSNESLDRRAKEFVGSRKLPEPLVMVCDPGMEMITSWGLRWDAPRETAYPSAYVIGASGRVKWAKVSNSHSDRATVEEILKAISNL